MAANPNAIFGQALAVGPRQIPLSELQGQMAQTAQTQAQTQNIASEMAERAKTTAALAQQNEWRQRQMDDDQAVRDALSESMKGFPVTAPNASLPTAGVDKDGNPLPNPPGYHADGARSAVQLQLPDIHGAYVKLIGQGRINAADTLLKTVQGIQTTDLENAKLRAANLQVANDRKNEISGAVMKTAQEDPASLPGVLAQAGITLENEGHIPQGAGASWGLDDAKAMYRLTSGVQEPIRKALDNLGVTEAQIGEAKAGTKLKEAQAEVATETAAQAKISRQAAEEYLKNPGAELGPGGRIEKLGLPLKDTQRLQNQVMDIMTGIGTAEDKVKAVNKAKQDAIDAVRRMEQTTAEKGIPTVATEQALQFNAERRADRSYQFNSAQLEKAAQPVKDLQARMGRLQDTLDQNSPAADAAVGAQLIGIIAGGQGGRMNAAMAEHLVGGRSNWQKLLAAAQQWSPDPNAANSITANQRQQIRALAKAYQDRVTAKAKIIDDARTGLDSTDDINEHRRIVTKAQNDLEAADRPSGATPATGAPVRVTTKAQRDALPNGTQYIDSQGNIATKGR